MLSGHYPFSRGWLFNTGWAVTVNVQWLPFLSLSDRNMTAMLNLLTSARCLNSLYTERPFLKITQRWNKITNGMSQDTVSLLNVGGIKRSSNTLKTPEKKFNPKFSHNKPPEYGCKPKHKMMSDDKSSSILSTRSNWMQPNIWRLNNTANKNRMSN